MAATADPSFDVATIKPSAPGTRSLTQIRGNRFVTEGTTFLDLFKYAFDVHPDQVVGGPAWLRTEKFDVVADPETEKRPSSDQMKVLLQKLLVERFHVVMQRGQRVLPVYLLMKAAEVPKLQQSGDDPKGIPVAGYDSRGELEVRNATMANFATFLQRFVLDRPAIDQTGIDGHFDLVLRWTPESLGVTNKGAEAGGEATAVPNLFTAIREQLGLKLEARKVPAKVFLIEGAEPPVEN